VWQQSHTVIKVWRQSHAVIKEGVAAISYSTVIKVWQQSHTVIKVWQQSQGVAAISRCGSNLKVWQQSQGVAICMIIALVLIMYLSIKIICLFYRFNAVMARMRVHFFSVTRVRILAVSNF